MKQTHESPAPFAPLPRRLARAVAVFGVVALGLLIYVASASATVPRPPTTAAAFGLTGPAARQAIEGYMAESALEGYTSGGVIERCTRLGARKVTCLIIEFDVEAFGMVWDSMTGSVRAVRAAGGNIILYDALTGRV